MNSMLSLLGKTEAEVIVLALEAAGYKRQDRLTSFVKKVNHTDPFVPGFIAIPDSLTTFDQAIRHCGRHVFNKNTPAVFRVVAYETSQQVLAYAAKWDRENSPAKGGA